MKVFNITIDEHERALVMKILEVVITDGISSPRKLGTMDLLRRFRNLKEGWLPDGDRESERAPDPSGHDTNPKPDRKALPKARRVPTNG